MINIIQKGTASTIRATVDKLQYSGSFMEIPQLTVSVKSPTAITFEIGDFITWGYDGLTYTLKELPQVHKQATSGSYDEAFVYDNMIFKSALGDVKYIDFLDVVPSSSISHFSSLPTFSFYGNVFALIDRLNANLGRLYANWIVQAADVESGDIYDALYTERQVDISSPVKVWDALGLVYSMWGLGFVYYYDTGTSKHTIVIGATGGATGNFSYGQGNGLYMVGKAINKEDAIVTRLRAYGSTRNMPARYYNNKVILNDRLLILDPLLYMPNLLIPYSKWAIIGDTDTAYINCNNPDVDAADTSYAKYGIREKSIFFDGTNNLKEIYPTIEQITAGEMRAAITGAQYNSPQYDLYKSPSVTEYPDATRLDKIKTGDTLTDDGIIKSDTIYTETATYTTQSANEVMTTEVITKRFDPIYYATLDNNGEYKITFTDQQLTVTGVNTDITDGTLRVWVQRNGSRVSLSKTIAATLITGGVEFTMPEIEISVPEGGDVYAIELDMDITIPTLGEGELATIHWVLDSGTATYTLTKVIPNTDFSISLKQIGFDIFRFLSNSGQNPVISMTSGACAGREFQIRRADYISATDSWNLTCVRQCDTSLSNQWFPNKNFHIAADDTFVLLNINMPDILIDVAELRLYDEACKWLRKNKEQQYIYEPKVDEVYMAINPQVIKEGMMMPITDTDLGLSGSKLINTVTITENEGAVRTFEVVLRDDADQDLIKYLNSQAKQISSAAVGTITNATTSTTQSVDTLPVTQPSQQTELGYTPENVANKTGVLSENSTTAQYLNAKALYDRIALLPHYSFGAVEFPTITDNGNGSVTIGNGTYCLADNVDGTGFITCYTITGNTFSLTDLTQNYIVANYNSGTPVLQVITNVTLINETTIVPVFSIFRNGNVLHTQWWNMLGAALSNKIHQSIVKTQRYRRESGLSLSEYGTRNLNLTSGRIWIGVVPMDLDAVLTATDNLSLWYHSAGSWTNTIQASYNNTQYDNGTDLVTLTNNRYAVNWIYRGVESQKHIYVVLGMGDYSLSDAQGAVVPALPTAISSHAVLVAKLIVQKNAATAISIQSAFDAQFSYSAPAAHNDLTGIEGGITNEYYHLSSAQHTIATQSATAARNGYLTSTDWSTFNGKADATGGSGYIQNQIASAQTADYWISGKAKMGTLLLPQTAPTLAASEIGLYALESGFSGELPSGAGSVTSIALTMPTGFSVSGSPITESGTFGVTFASGYFLPTTTQFASKADVSLIGAANGIAPLDSGGKVALQYLPSTLLKYMGVWDASTNTPTLTSPDTNRKGQVWNVSVAGTQFGIAFKLGDWLIYNDSGVAEKSDNSDDVVSVNGYTGAVTLKTSDIAEQTNLYYTDARVKAYADTLYTPLAHASATNNPHSVTAAQVGAVALTGDILSGNLSFSLDNLGVGFFGNGRIYKKSGTGIVINRGQNEENPKIENYAQTALYTIFHEGNLLNIGTTASSARTALELGSAALKSDTYFALLAGSISQPFSASKLTSTTLLLPQTAPTLASGEMAIYGLESGFSGETPSGAGSVTSISMVVPTGLSVTPTTITESGTFTISYASGYQMMTSTESSKLAGIEANANNYTLPTATNLVLGGVKIGTNVTITDGVISVHNPITLGTANGLSLSTQVLSLGLASTSTNGALSSDDWNTFNSKAAGDHTHAFAVITDKPTTISGYGITDALTTSNYSSYALPLSGGTITGATYIGASDNTSWLPLRFRRSGVTGFVGVGGTALQLGLDNGYLDIAPTNLTFVENGTTSRTVIHSGNYSSYALPLSGGTLSNNLIIQKASGDAYTKYISGTTETIVGTDANGLFVSTGGVLKYYIQGAAHRFFGTGFTCNGYEVVHAGNIGSQSVNYATNANNAEKLKSYYPTGNIDVNTYLSSGGALWYYGQGATMANIPSWFIYGSIYQFNSTTSDSLSLQIATSTLHDTTTPSYKIGWRMQNNLGYQNDWKEIIHSGNIGSQSVNYATSAGNADTLDTYHASYFAKEVDRYQYGITDLKLVSPMFGFFASAPNPANSPNGVYDTWVQGIQFGAGGGNTDYRQLLICNGADFYIRMEGGGNWGDWRKLYDTGNLTNTLSNGYLPYWNGSSLVNSQITSNGTSVGFSGTAYDSPKLLILTHTEPSVYSGYIGLRQEGLAYAHISIGTRSAGVDYMGTLNVGNGNVGVGYFGRNEKFAVNGDGYFNGKVLAQSEIALLNGGGLGSNGAGASSYPVSAFESYGWNFTIQEIQGGQFGIWNASRTTKYFSIVNGGSAVFSNSVTMTENINTNLRIPKVAPTNPTSGEYYFYIVE